MPNNEKQKERGVLTHSLTGNTSGSNNVQTMINILKQTANNTTTQTTESIINKSKKESE